MADNGEVLAAIGKVHGRVDELAKDIGAVQTDVAVVKERLKHRHETPCAALEAESAALDNHLDDHKATRKTWYEKGVGVFFYILGGVVLAWILYLLHINGGA